jgi:hypothetical protein
MSKYGVGVGDDFPVDDGRGRGQQGPEDDRAEFEEWKRRRDAWRAQREAYRAQGEEWRRRRDEWRAQWKEQRRAWRDQYRDTYRGFGDDSRRWHPPFYMGYGLWRALWIIALIGLVIFAFQHLGVIIVGMLALAALFYAYHHFGHDPFDLGPPDYSRPMTPPAPPSQPPAASPPSPPATA